MSNSLNSVGPDLGPNCLKSLSAGGTKTQLAGKNLRSPNIKSNLGERSGSVVECLT